MLYLAKSLGQLQFGQLMQVYEEGNMEKARQSQLDLSVGLLQAEQDFFQYLREGFFAVADAMYAIWLKDGCYVCALRLEPYQDGLLLAALETAPQHRRKGYARQLIHAVFEALPDRKIYSHVDKRNQASLRVHKACGFQKILDYARYIDGSVHSQCVTLCWQRRV